MLLDGEELSVMKVILGEMFRIISDGKIFFVSINVGIPELSKNGTLQEKMSADIQTYGQL